MATNHIASTNTYTVSKGSVTLKDISTPASNIKILSFSRKYNQRTKKTIAAANEYGINGSFFAMSTDSHISNLAWQNGVRQGYFLNDSEVPEVNGVRTDGFTNSVGKSIIYFKNNQVHFSTSVTSSGESWLAGSTWIQGGIGLFLGYQDWESMFKKDGEGQYVNDSAKRSAMVINTVTNRVYLIACTSNVMTKYFREAIMQRFQIQEGDTNHKWRGIMLDGGGSTQLLGSGISVSSERPIPQMVALINKN